jgi:hypothetical protein
VSHSAGELSLRPGEAIDVPVKVLRSTKLAEPVRLELRPPEELAGMLAAAAVVVPPGQTEAVVRITCAKDAKITGEYTVTIRGTAMQAGQLAVVSETGVVIEFPAK